MGSRDVVDRGTDPEVRALLETSGGKPIVQIVWDPDTDAASIRSAGMEHALIPRLLLSLGGALSGGR